MIEDQGKYYQVDLVRVKEMATLNILVKIWRTQQFDINWEKRVDLRYASQMSCMMEMKMKRLRLGHL